MVKRGIDISAHQGNINLSALKDQIDFVIIRVGYGTKGTLDSKFKRNVDLCEELGIPYGFYWYSYALDVKGASQEADYFLKAIASYKPTMGCWFDMEDADGYKKRNGMPPNTVLKNMCYEFCDKVEKAGYYAGIYASLSWFDNQLTGGTLKKFDKWVAQWPTSKGKQKGLDVDPNTHKDWSLWQFTSDGKFTGYNGKLDTNYAYKTFTNPKDKSTTPTTSTVPTGTTLELAVKTVKGEYGNDEERKNKLGSRYKEVQDFINHIHNATISTLVKEVKAGKYGDGDVRKTVLGSRYGEVQNEINKKATVPVLHRWDKVKFTGTKSYSGLKLADWTHNAVFDVIEVSGDRIVIGEGTAVTAAVNIKDCKKV